MSPGSQISAGDEERRIPEFDRIDVVGLPVDVASRADTRKYVQRVIETRSTCRHGFLNAGKVVMAHQDPELYSALETCDLVSPDGMSIVWASRFLGTPLPERVNGTNLMLALCEMAAQEGYRVYLLGARPDVVADAETQLLQDYPGLKIVGKRHGYFDESEEPAIAEEIRRSEADIIFVGISSPKKELWLQRNVPLIGVPFCMGVGGSFDVVAGRVERAPVWMQEAGLEWLWRFAQEPRKMWPRYMFGNPNFIWLVFRQWWTQTGLVQRERAKLREPAELAPEGAQERHNVLGVGVNAVDLPQALDIIEGWIERREANYVCVTPAHGIMDCYNEPELREIFNNSGLTVPDGMSLVWLLWLSRYPNVGRVYGPDLLLAMCERSVEPGYRHFFYGGRPGVVEDLADVLRARFPGLQIAGTHTPPFRPPTAAEDEEIVRQIREAQPDVLWVGISTPKQERWMADHVEQLDVPALVGVGAAFDFVSGHKRQAPRWIQRSGFEWLFRLANEPRRLWPRYRQYPRFALLVLADMLRLRGPTDSGDRH